MNEYIVYVPEVHHWAVRVSATSPAEAHAKARQGEGQYIDNGLEYSHTIYDGDWTVEEA